MPRLKGSADLLEDRRKRALALLDSGESLNEVGRRIGCNPSSEQHRTHPAAWRIRRRRGKNSTTVSKLPCKRKHASRITRARKPVESLNPSPHLSLESAKSTLAQVGGKCRTSIVFVR